MVDVLGMFKSGMKHLGFRASSPEDKHRRLMEKAVRLRALSFNDSLPIKNSERALDQLAKTYCMNLEIDGLAEETFGALTGHIAQKTRHSETARTLLDIVRRYERQTLADGPFDRLCVLARQQRYGSHLIPTL